MVNVKELYQTSISRQIAGLESLVKDEALVESAEELSAKVTACTGKGGKVILSGIGKSGLIAAKVAASFCATGVSAISVHPTEANHGDMGVIAKNDLVIMLSNSGNSLEMSDMANYLANQKIEALLVTRKFEGLIQHILGKDKVVVLENLPEACDGIALPTTSTTMMLAWLETVAIINMKQRGFSSGEHALLHPSGTIGQNLKIAEEVMRNEQKSPLPLALKDDTMDKILIEMSEKALGVAFICDNKTDRHLIGVITDGDLRRYLQAHDCSLKAKAEDVMTKNPRSVHKDTMVKEVKSFMHQYHITNIPVLDSDKKILGVIHIHDLDY